MSSHPPRHSIARRSIAPPVDFHTALSITTLTLLLACGSSAAAQGAAPRPAQLSGTVVADDTGQPVAGVTVRAGDRSVRTDAGGRFEIPAIAPGRYVVTAAFNGYETTAAGQRTPREPRPPIELTEGAVRFVEVRLIPLGIITGRIVDAEGRPASRVRVSAVPQVRLSSAVTNTRGTGTTTDADGQFTLRGLPRGNYIVSAERHEARQPMGLPTAAGPFLVGERDAITSYYPATAYSDQARALPIDAGVSMDRSFALAGARLARITGQIFTSDGGASGDFLVLPVSRPPQPARPASIGVTTFADGRFEITGVPLCGGDRSLCGGNRSHNGSSVNSGAEAVHTSYRPSRSYKLHQSIPPDLVRELRC